VKIPIHKEVNLDGKSQSVFVGFNYAFGGGKTKTCNANKEDNTKQGGWRTVLEKPV
jgi:hypothetical protein